MTLGELLENVQLEDGAYLKVLDYDMALSDDEFGYYFREKCIADEPLDDANIKKYKDYTVLAISEDNGYLIVGIY